MQKEMDGFVDDILVLYGVNIGGWMVRFLGEYILWFIWLRGGLYDYL